jgi:DtxR family Mn-dependent transcriptional regulator
MNPWIIAGILLLLAAAAPRYGLLALWRNWRLLRRREQVEDALKLLLDRQQEGGHATADSLAGSLRLGPRQSMRLVARMEAQGLLETRGHDLHLTPEGERWALHVARAHRLWERYLADEARMPLAQIHAEAHRREHRLSTAELDSLEAALGFPLHDPHGDPIPDRDGRLAAEAGVELTNWQAEGPARIVHLEDEPALAYSQILASGLRLGQTVRLLEKTPERYVLSDGENEYRLAPAVAANVHVVPFARKTARPAGAIPLDRLKPDQKAEIVNLDPAVQGFTRRRFLDLGLTPGTLIYPELRNAFGEPRAYRVRGTLIALRNNQAEQIWVRPLN